MILVTGGSGLVGAHLLFDLVKNNLPVKAIYRSEKSLEKISSVFSYYTENPSEYLNKISFIQADLLDLPKMEAALVGVTQVVHAAAFISFSKRDYKKMRAVNIDGTAQLVNLALAHGVKKFVYLSSIATLSGAKKNSVLDESTPFEISLSNYGYAISKHGAELEVWRGQQEGMSVTVLKPGVIIGPGFWSEHSGKIFSSVNKGLKFYALGATGFVGVWDVVNAIIYSLQQQLKSDTYVLVSENLTYQNLFEMVAKALGKKAPTIPLNRMMVGFLWRLSWLNANLFFGKDFFPKKTAQSVFNISRYNGKKISEELEGFEYIPFVDSVKKTAEYFSEDHN